MQEVKHYKVKNLPSTLRPNSVYYEKPSTSSAVKTYITDQSGFPYPLIDLNNGGIASIVSVTGTGVTGTPTNPVVNISTFKSNETGNLLELSLQDGKLFVKPISSPDGSLNITPLQNTLSIELSSALLALINSALQSGDNISNLSNDVGYITSQDLPTKTSELLNDGADGTSIYVETQQLGQTAFTNSYNDLNNLPTIINPSGLEAINQGGGIGWRLIGRNPLYFGSIGQNAIDFSFSSGTSSTRGATGPGAAAFGYDVVSSGWGAFVSGYDIKGLGTLSFTGGITNTNQGYSSFVWGTYNTVTGYSNGYHFVSGIRNTTGSFTSNLLGCGLSSGSIGTTIVGQANIVTTGGQNDPNTPMFIVGNGDFNYNPSVLDVTNRSNALEVYKSGSIIAPTLTSALINSGGVKSLVTKEYVDTVVAGGAAVWGNISGILSNQTDLHNALNNKANVTHTHSQIESGDAVVRTSETIPLEVIKNSTSHFKVEADGRLKIGVAPAFNGEGAYLGRDTLGNIVSVPKPVMVSDTLVRNTFIWSSGPQIFITTVPITSLLFVAVQGQVLSPSQYTFDSSSVTIIDTLDEGDEILVTFNLNTNTAVQEKEKLHDFSNGYSYCGVATKGTETYTSSWKISRIQIFTDGKISKLSTTGVWDNRYSLNYT
jgi:hypothetical protein